MEASQITVERGILDQAGARAAERLGAGTAALLTDERVDALYAGRLEASLRRAGWRVVRRAFPAGEASKTLATYTELIGFLAEQGLTRSDTVFALGGGVVGDMAGFAAATYLRGVHLVQIPTTLLACVDSSVGGKVAVDLPEGKNLVGAFYAPHMVLIDPDTLDTLPEDVFRDGMAEVVKYAAIADAALIGPIRDIRRQLGPVIERCVAIKSGVVAVDARDTGLRQILNFGHTFGHAIERLSGYKTPHGAAVAAGMAIMARACARQGLCADGDARQLIALLDELGLPTATDYTPEQLARAAQSDKKRAGDAMVLIVLGAMGRAQRHMTTLAGVKTFLEAGWAPWS